MRNLKTFLFASPNDSNAVLKITRNCTFFNYYIDQNGALAKKNPPMGSQSRLLYLSDYGTEGVEIDTAKVSRELAMECQGRRMGGVFFDFENPNSATLLGELCHGVGRFNIAVFVPRTFAGLYPSAKVVIPSAVSGGNYEQMLRDARASYGADNICLDIVRSRQDFIMPSYLPDGKSLTQPELDGLIEQYNPSVFFSKDLCSKYFTYRSSDGSSHFVMFDDASTAKVKMDIAESLGIFGAFLLFSDFGDSVKELMVV